MLYLEGQIGVARLSGESQHSAKKGKGFAGRPRMGKWACVDLRGPPSEKERPETYSASASLD